MSTRAILIRKTPGENTLQWGQTKWDGYDNTYKLNRHWNTPDLVEQLFERLVKEDRGISSLGYDMEDTVWYSDSYNCGTGKVDLLDEEGVPSWQKMSKWFYRHFDWPGRIVLTICKADTYRSGAPTVLYAGCAR